MKKIIILTTFLISIFLTSPVASAKTEIGAVSSDAGFQNSAPVEAANAAANSEANAAASSEQKGDKSGTSTGKNVVLVTEKVPGANCDPAKDKPGMFRCETDRGFGAVMAMMGMMLKYFTFLCGLFSVLALVVGGIMYSMGGASEEMKNNAKDYIAKSLMGLVVLLLSGSILYAVAPWIYQM